jgi:two-component system chemotaxis sensor kinase CheA
MTQGTEDLELLDLFLEETRERIEAIEPALIELEQSEVAADRQRILHEIFRHLHSTKGSAGYLGLDDLVALLHAAEQLADVLRNGAPLQREHVDLLLRAATLFKGYLVALATDGPVPEGLPELSVELDSAAAATSQRKVSEQRDEPVTEPVAPREDSSDSRLAHADTDLFAATVRVPMDVLDRLGRLAEEMLVTRNRITSLATSLQDLELTGTSKKLSVMVSELQDIASMTRLQPISYLFSQMPRVVRDAARSTGKEAEVTVEGGSLEVDRRILQELRDPLVHLLRNCADHGLEMPETRIAALKPSRGIVRLTANREGSNLVIEVADDGAGIDFDAVREKAVERGFVQPRDASSLSEQDLINLLLRPGFSTRDVATNLSGRGVGMDVVSVRMQELGGNLAIQSSRGQGTTVRLMVPTSVSVVNTLVFTSKGYLLGIPYNYVQEIVRIDESQIERYGAQEVFRLRDQLVPLFTLDDWPDRRADFSASSKRYVLVLRDNRAVAGLWCDGIARFEELIVKPAGRVIRGVDVISGLASLGTGEIVQILDPVRLLVNIGVTAVVEESIERSEAVRHLGEERAPDALAERMILVQGYGAQRYALPVRLVSRIVQFNEGDLVAVGEMVYLRQGGDLIPLLDLDGSLGLGPGARTSGIALLLVSEETPCALSALQVVRIGVVSVRPEHTDHPNVIGLLSLPDAVYLLVDVASLLHERLRGFFDDGLDRARGQLHGRVLLVEDSAFQRDSLDTALSTAGMSVVACASVERAIEALQHEGSFDLIVSDYLLPGQSGLDLVRTARSSPEPQISGVPILVISQHLADSHGADDLRERLLAAGATEVAAKFTQVDQQGMLAVVRRLLRHELTRPAQPVIGDEHGQDRESCHVLAVNLGSEAFGIPISQVREITTLVDLTTTPLSRADYLGLANIRGEIIPTFDLGGILGRSQQSESVRQADVVIVTTLGPMVLRCDSIRGTIRIPESDLRAPTGNLGNLAKVVHAVVTLPDCLLQVLDIDPLAASCLARRELSMVAA